jgi:hypothetical protein
LNEPSNGHFYASNCRFLRNFLNLNLNNHLYKPFKVPVYPELWVHIDTIYLLPHGVVDADAKVMMLEAALGVMVV